MGNKKLLVLMLAVIVFMVVMGLTVGNRGQLTWPERFVKDTVSWMQGLFYKPARVTADFFDDLRNVRVVYEENKKLKMRLSQYAKDTMRLNDLEAQNKRFKELLGFTERQKQLDNYTYHVAEVISDSPDPYANIVNINLGSKDGMKPDMAVISVDGLLGRVDEVSEFYSSVQLLIDDSANAKGIAATVRGHENDVFGIVNYDREKQTLVMTKIEQTNPIEVGDTIITSGLGEVFPKGIVIGKVTSKEMGEFGITYKANIQPASGFRHLREVLVVEVPAPR